MISLITSSTMDPGFYFEIEVPCLQSYNQFTIFSRMTDVLTVLYSIYLLRSYVMFSECSGTAQKQDKQIQFFFLLSYITLHAALLTLLNFLSSFTMNYKDCFAYWFYKMTIFPNPHSYILTRDCHDNDRMVIAFTTITTQVVSSSLAHGEVYAIKFISDLQQFDDFSRVLHQ